MLQRTIMKCKGIMMNFQFSAPGRTSILHHIRTVTLCPQAASEELLPLRRSYAARALLTCDIGHLVFVVFRISQLQSQKLPYYLGHAKPAYKNDDFDDDEKEENDNGDNEDDEILRSNNARVFVVYTCIFDLLHNVVLLLSFEDTICSLSLIFAATLL